MMGSRYIYGRVYTIPTCSLLMMMILGKSPVCQSTVCTYTLDYHSRPDQAVNNFNFVESVDNPYLLRMN